MQNSPAPGNNTPRRDADYYRRQLEAISNNATLAIFIMNEHQHCVFMNPAAEKLTGYRFEEAQGRPLHDVVHHTRPDGTPYPLEECPIDRVFPQNNQEQGEEIFVHKDGSFYPVSFTASPIRESGDIVGTIIEVRDIRAQKTRERERERLLTAEKEAREESETIRQIGQLISGELDLQKIVQAVTDAATELTRAQFGAFFYNVLDEQGASYMLYTLSGVDPKLFSDFPMPRATHVFAPTFKGEGTVRVGNITKDNRYGKNPPYNGMPGGHLPVHSYLAVPVVSRGGEVIGGLFFGHEKEDVFTERDERIVEGLAAQAAIAMDNARLFDTARREREKAEAAARENELLLKEAREASRLKDEFLATVSHELRTPLTAILGWTRLLMSDALDEPNQKRALETIDRNARSQAQIIEDILDVSRIISGKLRLDVQLVDPKAVVEQAIESLRPAAEAKGIRLQRLLDPLAGPVSGDADRLQQIVWNLLSNAIKFTEKGGRVQVRLERINSHVEIVVSDSGQGIAPEFLPHVFERFRQADSSTSRAHGGLGLGLSIVRQLVEMHGGGVAATSEGEGRGSTFTVSLPLTVVSRPPAAADNTERIHPRGGREMVPFDCPPQLSGLRILVADDEEDARILLNAVLTQCRAEVFTVSTADAALNAIDDFEPHILVSDIGMPEKDGYYLIGEIRRREAAKSRRQLPAVALTAYARVEDRMRALGAGFQMHIPKPVEPAELVAVLASLTDWKPE